MRQKDDLRDSQRDITGFLYEREEAICVARPGAGKTISALTAIEELIRDGHVRHALVIAPKRVARQVWPDEIADWAHTLGLRYAVLDGTPKERMALLHDAGKRDLTIIGLDNVQWLLDELDDWDIGHPIFDLLVIDEISRLRNPTGKRAKALSRMAIRWSNIWGLSGTLRPSGPEDLFMPVRVVTKGKLWGKSFYKWRQERFRPTDYMGYNWAPLPGEEERINAEIAPLIIAPELPPQAEPLVVLDKVELPREARILYDQMERRLMIADGDDDIVAASSAVASGKLAQMANGFVYDENTVSRPLHDVKREWLKELVESATGPTLLIYQFIEDLYMIRDVCGDIPYLGGGASDADADKAIRAWNAGELPFMALHPASGGHGLNLQHGGSDMAWIAPTWSPEFWEQTIARIARSGQTKPVIVRVCVAINTVDEMKLSRVHLKMSAQEAFERYLRRVQAAPR